MENASKALIIAGRVLISLLVIAALVFMFNQLSDLRQTQEDASIEDKLQSFYANLDTYIEGNKRGNDILSLANLITDFNNRRAGGNESKYGNEGYEPIELNVHYNTNTIDWETTVFFKGHEKELLSVVDSIFASGYLTAGGQGINDTIQTITDAGFTYEIESA